MTQNKKIALTGGIGSGKSAAAEILKNLGYPVFSCDEIYAEMCGEQEFLSLLAQKFPGCVVQGKLDRKSLSRLVFSDHKALEELNALSHPLVYERLFGRMEGYPLSFAEVPLLFESGRAAQFDGVFALMRDRDARIKSIRERSGLTEEEALSRMAEQFDYSSLPAGVIQIPNNGSLKDLEDLLNKAVLRVLEKSNHL